MYGLALQDENMEKAHLLVEKESELARIFEMGEYHEVVCRLELAVLEKDVETAIDTIQKMLASLDGIGDFSKSSLYEHLTFKRVDKSFATGVKENLLKALREDERTEFLKNDERWQTFCYLNDIFENKN